MLLAISRFTLANDESGDVREAFSQRPHRVSAAQGFLRMEVANTADNDREFWLLTRRAQEPHFHDWHRGQNRKASHTGIARELTLDPKGTPMPQLKVFAL